MPKRLPPTGYTAEAIEQRRVFLAAMSQPYRQCEPDAPEDFCGLAENQVGSLSLPVSIAGPLQISGTHAKGIFYVPLCTVEGSLALSMTRGCYLCYLCGGIRVRHLKQSLNRSPIFRFASLDDAARFSTWVKANFQEIKRASESDTKHGKLIEITQHSLHTRIILNFSYSTGDAAGQNMVTLATHQACKFIKESYPGPIGGYLLESNLSGDKNASWHNFSEGRGHQVIAECLLKKVPLKRLLRVDLEEFYACDVDKNIGTLMGGVQGSNAHSLNALAALYLATGQDVASIGENAGCSAVYEMTEDGNILVTLKMPGAAVGTVGGATRLAQQRANLEMLDCVGDGGAKKLAEIICAAALALELSLLGAIASDEFAEAHRTFGRA